MNPLNINAANFKVATDNDRLVGFAQLRPLGDVYELASVYVEPVYRNRGIGSDLVRLCLEAHKDAGLLLTDIYLITLEDTVEWYLQFGASYPVRCFNGHNRLRADKQAAACHDLGARAWKCHYSIAGHGARVHALCNGDQLRVSTGEHFHKWRA